ncbi:putative diguanylate cyclase AdrA [Thalassocella blandensis]|nr:putative diguanylate cyclase AdrA [Thalassocella blandensis]
MNTINQWVNGSGQPDFALIDRLARWQSKTWTFATLLGVLLLAITSLSLIFKQALSSSDLFAFNSAFLTLVGGVLAYFVHKPQSFKRLWLIRLSSVIMLIAASYFLLEAWLEKQWIAQSIVRTPVAFEPLTEFSIQTYLFFILYSVISCLEVHLKKPWWRILDGLTLILAFNVLLMFFGFCLQCISASQTGVQAFYSLCITLCIFAMFMVLVIKRVQTGIFSVFVGVGIGSEVSRIIAPVLVVLPLLIVGLCLFIDNFAVFSLIQVATMIAAVTACGLIGLSMRLANHVNGLEKQLMDMSLTDDLTNIYNRRGFYLLGEHMLREGKRSGEPVMVLFFDLDGLKAVNDSSGHDVGSTLLVDFAELLRSNFRSSDVVARVGGDEFAVVTQQDAYKVVLNRLKNTVESANRNHTKAYTLNYSVGVASTVHRRRNERFDDLVKEADARMYARKKAKRSQAVMSQTHSADCAYLSEETIRI